MIEISQVSLPDDAAGPSFLIVRHFPDNATSRGHPIGAACSIQRQTAAAAFVKQTSLNSPLYVGIAHNSGAPEGFFDQYSVVNPYSPYFVSVGELNNDDRLDLVATDDGADRYYLNQGNDASGTAEFISYVFSFNVGGDDGFGSNSIIADLNNDGWNDVLIADVDVDIGSCSRRMHIYRNLGGTPGSNVTLQEQTNQTNCGNGHGNPPSCLVANIPADMLQGVHDVAVPHLLRKGLAHLRSVRGFVSTSSMSHQMRC